MKNVEQFHDGALEGLLIEEGTLHVFLRAQDGARSVAVVAGLVKLRASEVLEGSIIYEVLVRGPEEIGSAEIRDLYGASGGAANTEEFAESTAREIRERKAEMLEINPSYGASCLALGAAVEILPRRVWQERFTLGVA